MASKMRKIPLQETILRMRKYDQVVQKFQYVEEPFNYRENLLNILYTPPLDERSGQPRGFLNKENHQRLKIIDALEDAGEYVLLSEDDYVVLNEAVQSMRWGILGQAIDDFVKEIEEAGEVDVAEAVK